MDGSNVTQQFAAHGYTDVFNLARDPTNGKLYASRRDAPAPGVFATNIFRVNETDGSLTAVANITAGDTRLERPWAYNLQGEPWMITDQKLLRLNETSFAVVSSINITDGSGNALLDYSHMDMSFHQNGTLYIVRSGGVGTLNTSTGVETLFGNTHASTMGLAWYYNGAKLFATRFNSAATPDLFSLDSVNGSETELGTSGLPTIHSLVSLLNAPPPPSPSPPPSDRFTRIGAPVAAAIVVLLGLKLITHKLRLRRDAKRIESAV